MAHRPGVSAILSALAVGVFLLLVFITDTRHTRPMMDEEDMNPGGEGGPRAAQAYDWMRFHDPATGVIPADIYKKEHVFSAHLPTREAVTALKKSAGATAGPAFAWTQRGPYNVGGRTRALAIDVTNSNLILAGGVSGGMWRSTDGGSSWTRTTLPTQLYSVSCIAQDTRPGKTSVWYYGTGELIGNSASGGGAAFRGDGIFKSVDGGQSWNLLSATSTGQPQNFDQMFDYVSDIVIDPSTQTEDRVYVSSVGGISRSTDGGTTWTTVLGGFNDSRYADVAITGSGVLYASMSALAVNGSSAASAGIWRSTDGVHWANISGSFASWPSAYNRIVIGIAHSNQNILYFLGQTPGSGYQTNYAGSDEANSFWKYTYLSGDGSGAGGQWEDRSANLPAYGGQVGNFASQSSYDLVVSVKPDNDSTVFVGGTNLYRSTDGFRTSTHTTWIGGYSTLNDVSQYTNHHPDQHVLLPGGGSVLYSANDGGLSRSSDGGASVVSWTSLNHGYVTSQFYSIAVDHATPGNNIILGGTQDNGTWFTGSNNARIPWVNVLGGDGGFCAIANGRESYYASFYNGVTYRLILNNSGSGTDYTRIDPTNASGFLFINPFVLDPNNSDIMYFPAGRDLWRNSKLSEIPLRSDNTTSKNWTNLDAAGIPGSTISAVSVSSSSPANRVYYGSNNGKVYRLDNADTATVISTPTDVWTGKGLPAGAYVSCIAVDPTNGDRALMTFSNYNVLSIFFTSDGGNTWSPVGGNLEEHSDGSGNGPSVRCAAILPLGGLTYYLVGTSTGLYSTTSLSGMATTWAREGAESIGNAVVDMIDTRTSDGLVVVATHGVGVFSGSAIPTSVASAPSLPSAFALRQNFPNPFNPSTTIRYSLAQPGRVVLKVFSVTGEEVATIVDDHREAGEYSVQWTPVGLASGVYFYRLQAGAYSDVKKLVLLK